MDGCTRHTLVEEEIIEVIGSTLAVDEDDCARWCLVHQQVIKGLLLCLRGDVDYLLVDILMCATNAANTDANMILAEMLLCQITNGLWKSCRKQQVGNVALLLICGEIVSGESRRIARENCGKYSPPPDII